MNTNIEPGMHVRALNCLAPSGVVISVDQDTALVQRNGTAIRPEYVFVWEIEPITPQPATTDGSDV